MPFCPRCGTGNPDAARFCQSCGKPLPVTGGAPAGASGPYAPPAAGPASGPYPQFGGPPAQGPVPPPGSAPYPPGQPGYGVPGYPPAGAMPARRKNPSTACALGLLWGFGGQAFYNGQNMKAVVQIIVNVLIMWPTLQATGGGGAMILGLGVAGIFMADGYKIAKKINEGVPVGPWTFF